MKSTQRTRSTRPSFAIFSPLHGVAPRSGCGAGGRYVMPRDAFARHDDRLDDPAMGWPEPDLAAARQNRRSPPPLPIEVFGPMWSEWIAAAAEGASCPVDYVAAPLLAAAS